MRALLAAAAFLQDTPTDGKSFWGWFPPNINPAYGGKVDFLYMVIMVVVLVAFFATEGILIWCCIAYRDRPGHKARYIHGSNKLEWAWTIVPALLLLALALGQRKTWADIKATFPDPKDAFTIQVYPKQFKWNFRYPTGKDKNLNAPWGDKYNIVTLGDFNIPVSRMVLTKMSSKDVIHSFFIPHARVKQDVVPGMQTKTWFKVDRIPCWNIKEKKTEFLSEDEFNGTVVSLNGLSQKDDEWLGPEDWSWDHKRRGATEKDAKGQWVGGSNAGYFEDDYVPNRNRKQIRLLDHGKLRNGTHDEAKYVHHWCEIACAELCGLGHTTMNAQMRVHTLTTLKLWLDREIAALEEGESIFAPDWKVWDRYYAEFNKP